MLSILTKPENKIFEKEPETKKQEERYNPYINNEGTVMAIAGKDYVIVAGDTRLSNSYSIESRNTSKLCKLTETCIMSASGMHADIVNLEKYLKARIEIYRSTNKRDPSLESIAQMLSVTLYSKRFFPYYSFTVLSGKKEDGSFTNYGYDAIGSYEQFKSGATGSGQKLVVSVLDNVLKRNPNINENEAKKLILDTMNGASCRDIHTGDAVEIMVLRSNGDCLTEKYPLRRD